jgi:hypothetical protein
MKRTLLAAFGLAAAALVAFGLPAISQTGPAPALEAASDDERVLTDYSKWTDAALNAELARRAVIERKSLMPMRDGVHLSTDIYRPKDVTGPVPTIFVRTPYNMNTLTGALPAPGRSKAVDRGYAVYRPERARPLFLRRRVRDPRLPAHRRLRRAHLDCRPAVVQQEGWHARLLVHCRVAAPARRHQPPGARRHGADGLRRRHRPRRRVPRAGQLVSRRRAAHALLHLALRHRQSDARPDPGKPRSGAAPVPLGSTATSIRRSPTVTWSKQVWHLPYAEMLTSLGEPAGHEREADRPRQAG